MGKRVALTLLAFLSVCPTDRLSAQWLVQLSAGARYSTPLVQDSIVNGITVRSTLAPVFALTLTTPFEQGWAAEAALDVTIGGLRREETGADADLGGLTTLAISVAARREIVPTLYGRVGFGALFYAPEDDSGIFSGGAGGARPTGLLAVQWVPPFGERWDVTFEGRYDIHRFITPALRNAGFDEQRFVHRVAIAVRGGLGARSP